jgi:hypothetical protein
MAVCGRCWLCGTKFDCSLTDVGAVVVKLGEDYPEGDLTDMGRKLCTSCVAVIDGEDTGEPNEPHSNGKPASDRLAEIVGMLVKSCVARGKRP